MVKDISKTIHFKFSNRFTKQWAVIVDTPYLPFLAVDGYYSRLFKGMKEAAAFKCDHRQMKGKIWYTAEKLDRTIITFPSGVKLNMPYDVNEKDIKIIKHYLEGLRMAVEAD